MNGERFHLSEEVKLVPGWAIALAVCIFLGGQGFLVGYAFPREPNPPPLALQIFLGCLVGGVLAFFALMVGYVNQDTRRRGMNRALWTVLVIFIPNAIGFILYFLTRQPIVTHCPRCGAAVNRKFNFCPKCSYELQPVCGRCKAAAQPGAAFCPYCGNQLESPPG